MSRQVRQAQINTTNIDVWLEDPDITELRRAELLVARDRVAAIQTAMIINGMAKETAMTAANAKEVVDAKRKRSKKSKVR